MKKIDMVPKYDDFQFVQGLEGPVRNDMNEKSLYLGGKKMKMMLDEDGLLEEPCLSCDKAYIEDIWFEWCCDEKECKSIKEERR